MKLDFARLISWIKEGKKEKRKKIRNGKKKLRKKKESLPLEAPCLTARNSTPGVLIQNPSNNKT
jgi:hypothetical protein